MGYVWDFQIVWEYRQVFVRGAIITAQLTFWSTIIGTVLGLMLGLMRRSSNAALRYPAAIYIESFRATPILVQLVWIYYSMPILTGLQMGNVASCAIGLGLHAAAYIAEIFRAGVNSIERGLWDAARAVGMRYPQMMRRIILPQAVRRMIPPFINEFATLIKLTTLGSVLAVNELLHEATNLINNSYRPLEIYTAVAVAFAIMIYPFNKTTQRKEQHWR